MTHTEIEKLIDDFFEGKTSNREEEILYDYFARRQYPEHLAKYAPIFNSIKSELQPAQQPSNKPILRRRLLRYSLVGAIAACLIVAVINMPLFQSKAEVNPFEGSYMIVNYQKITDMEILMPEIEKTLALVSELRNELNIANQEILQQSQIYEFYIDHYEQ